MAHIYIYSPSTAVQDLAAFKRGIKRLAAMGHEVELDEAVLARHMRFAGDDATRIAAIGRAAASGADLAMIARGGYGLTRILNELPYKAIAKSIERGTQWIGLSDFTALQLALLAKTGASTWAGPCVCEDFIVEDESKLDEITLACFGDLVSGQAEGTGWRLPKRENAPYLIASNPIDPVTKSQKLIKISAKPGQSLMQAAAAANLSGIAADCGGCLSCATCHVFVADEWVNVLPPASADEASMLEMTATPRRDGSRLSCQIQLTGAHDGLVVALPAAQY